MNAGWAAWWWVSVWDAQVKESGRGSKERLQLFVWVHLGRGWGTLGEGMEVPLGRGDQGYTWVRRTRDMVHAQAGSTDSRL